MSRLVLASASPRRRELLGLLGIDFDVVATGVEELTDGEPADLVVENARRKAEAVERPGAMILGVDTDVVLEGRLLGKPGDADAAGERIRALAGRTHQVLSGIALVSGDRVLTDLVRTDVTFRALSDQEVEAYVRSGEWTDRAGGYAVQGLGSSLIASIDGDLSNVIGLPLPALARLVEKLQNG